MLLDAMPRIDSDSHGHKQPKVADDAETLLNVEDVKVHFPVRLDEGLFGRRVPLKAVDGV